MLGNIADTGLDRIGTGATGAGFWGKKETVGRNHSQPATTSEAFELNAFVSLEIPLAVEIVSEKDTILCSRHGAAAPPFRKVCSE